MIDTILIGLAIALIVCALTEFEHYRRIMRHLRRLEAANRLRAVEIAATDQKLEQYIATDERVMELWGEG